MNNTKYFYEKSNILNFKSNVTFHEILGFNENELNNYIDLLCNEVIEQWEKGIPPVLGKNEINIIKDFIGLKNYDVSNNIIPDPDGDYGIIKNKTKLGTSINQFFPTMMQTKISNGLKSDNGRSIYDYFVDPKLKKTLKQSMIRGVRRDSMYNFSTCLTIEQMKENSGKDYIKNFDRNGTIGLFIYKSKITTKLSSTLVELSKEDVIDLINLGYLDTYMLGNIDTTNLDLIETNKKGVVSNYQILIRLYEKNEKIFPKGLQVFRMGLCQCVVNFNPITAKTLYTHFTKHINQEVPITIYDPSSGWGGRLIGSLGMNRKVKYVGTDPNPDMYINDIKKSRYQYVGELFNEWTGGDNEFKIFEWGSEMIGYDKNFNSIQYDMVFTSPPYFNREQYSQDETQSFKKFDNVTSWVNGFLGPTLKTAFNVLKEDRYLLWNISDIQMGKNIRIPLEKYSCEILNELGMEYKGKIKMLMTTLKGLKPENIQNNVYLDGKYHKYEPIFVFYKPKK